MGGNFDCFDAFQPDRQNLTRQILKAIQCLVKDTDHPSNYFPSNILKVSIRQNFPLYGITTYIIVYVHTYVHVYVCLCVCHVASQTSFL